MDFTSNRPRNIYTYREKLMKNRTNNEEKMCSSILATIGQLF